MVVFDNYTGPAFEKDGVELRSGGKLTVPILRIRQKFLIGAVNCSRV